MRVIVDTSADRRTDPEVTQDVALLEAADDTATAEAGFRDPEYEVSCPVCDSRLSFRTSDAEAVIVGAGPNYTISCPVHGGTFEVDPRKAGTAAKAMSRLFLASSTGVQAGGIIGQLSGMRAGSALTIGADSAAGFSIDGSNRLVAAAGAAGVKTVNVVETLAGVYGSPRTTTFTVTIT
jgi:hypothetical protein